MNKLQKGLACLLAALLVLAAFPLTALAAESREVHIQNAEDLLELAENCSLDTWSDGLTVILDNDISLSGVDFEPIPIFNGSFDGQGHTIHDLRLTDAQSPCGFFLETGKDANIHALRIKGTVAPRGDDSAVGGVVGLNRGMISACSFSGTVAGKSQIGGVVGSNEATGMISGCSAAGSVTGLSSTGGIVGYNAGAVTACENSAYVNTESVDPALRLDAIDTSSILNFFRSLTSDNAGVTSDTGGIAGWSVGFVEHCVNQGTVGYLHLGYNVAGIAGRSSGYVDRCTNSGEIYGRRDVGGIVGQAEPYVEIEEAQNLLAGLGYRMHALNASIDKAVEDAGGYSDVLAGQLALLPGYLSPVAGVLAGLDPADPASLDELRDVLSDSVGSMAGEMEKISQNMDGSSDVLIKDFQDINNNLNALSETAMQAITLMSSTQQNTDILSDESNGETNFVLGKVAYCENTGAVNGDSNVGGVAGAIAIEDALDPENDLNVSGNTLVQSKLILRAAIVQGVNRGKIVAKHECVGGICGRMDLGIIGNCAAYGEISLDEGDYAGGVCGLTYGTIRSCVSKCALSGKRYIGGVVGNGYSSTKKEERDSLVSGCYSLVEIHDDPQFSGAISGGSEGVYENNFFVPAGFAGMDKLSIHGKAEPMPFEDFAKVEGLPEDCKSFTLRFVVDGETVKEVPFAYGDSFDRSVFPRVEKRDGAYAVWDRTDLTDLRFDTTVTAEYRMDETVLRSAPSREDGRAIVYVDGQFQSGDLVELELLEIEEGDINTFRGDWRQTVREHLHSIFQEGEPDYSICVSVAEKLRMHFSDDGQPAHTIRYLTPDGSTENHRLYLRTDEGYVRVHPDTFGSYYLLEVEGVEAELALVNTIQSWWVVAYVIGALVALALLALLIVRIVRALRRRKKKTHEKAAWIVKCEQWCKTHKKEVRWGGAGVVLAALAAVLVLRFSSISGALETLRLLKDFADQETAIQTHIEVHSDQRNVELDNAIVRVRKDGRLISCTEQYGIPIYFYNGLVYLENGRSFEVSGSTLDQRAVLELARTVFQKGNLEKREADGYVTYSSAIGEEETGEVLRLIISGDGDELLRAEQMTVELTEKDGALYTLGFSGMGSTDSGKNFTISASLKPSAIESRPTIPDAVMEAIAHGGKNDTEVLSEDLLILLAAWMRNDSSPHVRANVAVRADCGIVSLDSDYEYTRQILENTKINCLRTPLLTLYFTDKAACTESGTNLTEAQQRIMDCVELIPAAKELCLHGEFTCSGDQERRVYTVALDEHTASALAEKLIPDLKKTDLSLEDCQLQITVQDGELTDIEFACSGTVRIVSRDVESSVSVAIRYNDPGEGQSIPIRVRETLLG